MSIIILSVSFSLLFSLCVGLLLFLSWQKKWTKRKERWEKRAERLEEMARSAGSSNNEFYNSLMLAQTRLESLLVRAESVEQRLSQLVVHNDPGKQDQYATAAFLLENGENVEQVARRLKLSPAQVRLVQELRHEVTEKAQDGYDEEKVRIEKIIWGKNGLSQGENFAGRHNGVHQEKGN